MEDLSIGGQGQLAECFLDIFQVTVSSIFICYAADVKMNYAANGVGGLGDGLARNMLALEGIKQSEARLQKAKQNFKEEQLMARRREDRASENERTGMLENCAQDPDQEFVRCSAPDQVKGEEDDLDLSPGTGMRRLSRRRAGSKRSVKIVV